MAVARIAELIEPAAEAAQEWLESKDDDDRETIAEARERLLTALGESPDLAPTLARLARLLGTAGRPPKAQPGALYLTPPTPRTTPAPDLAQLYAPAPFT